jgi:Transposase
MSARAIMLRRFDADGRSCGRLTAADDQGQIEDLAAWAGRAGAEVQWAAGRVSPMASLLLAILVTSGQDLVRMPVALAAATAGGARRCGQDDARDARVIAGCAGT